MKITALVLLAVLWGGFSFAAEFTVDERSWYHVGVGVAVGAGVGIIETAEPTVETYLIATAAAAVAASAKEASDGYWDWGDWVFTVATAPLSLWAENEVELWIRKDVLGFTVRY